MVQNSLYFLGSEMKLRLLQAQWAGGLDYIAGLGFGSESGKAQAFFNKLGSKATPSHI